MAARKILIKKYENRRLYDATNSRYVNLEEVAQFVQRGDEVRVVDAAAGEDITRLILTQIIAEGAKTPDSSFPLDFLRQMVIASGRASQESAVYYTKAMLDFYQNTYRAMTPALNPFEFIQGAGAPPASVVDQPSTRPKSRPDRRTEPGGDEVNHLKNRVAELEKLVSTLVSKNSPRKKTTRRGSGRPSLKNSK